MKISIGCRRGCEPGGWLTDRQECLTHGHRLLRVPSQADFRMQPSLRKAALLKCYPGMLPIHQKFRHLA
ncbi:MAG: hypothetical protein ACYT04_00040 [Nostoc sp.]